MPLLRETSDTMNYAQARKRDDGSELWDWTTMNDKVVHRSRPCTEACQHTSEEDACRHFYDYCLEQVTVHEADAQYHCAVCGIWTSKSLGNQHLGHVFSPVFLCEAHLNKESLASVHPFNGAFQVIHS